MTTNPKNGRWRGALGLLAACAIGVVGFASPASAVSIAPHNINPNAKGSVTITKYATPESERPTQEGNGKEWTPPVTSTSVLLDGAEFTAYRVDITALNLKTNAGWQYLESFITPPAGIGPHPARAALETRVNSLGGTLTPLSAKTTGDDGTGVVKWTGLELGLYYFEETVVPTGHKASAPFFVTVPMTDPDDRDEWMYDIFVYPKNIKDTTVKVPQDKDVHRAGEILNWDIRTTIPGDGGATNKVNIMRFEDVLSDSLVYTHPNVRMQINNAWDSTATPGANELVYGTDFTATYDGGTKKVTATLLQDGLDKLNAKPGQTLIVRIQTTVVADFKGTIDNEAVLIVNQPGSTTETEKTEVPAGHTKFAEVTVNKTDTAGNPLPGAEFMVYYSHKEVPDFTVKTDPVLGIAPTTAVCNMVAPATSCKFSLRFSDYAENTQLLNTDPRYNYYFLVEKTAPTDYELLTDAIPFQITELNTTEAATGEFTLTTPISVKNVKRGGGIELPFTGGAGTIMFLVIGAALLAGATTMTVVRSRRRRVDA